MQNDSKPEGYRLVDQYFRLIAGRMECNADAEQVIETLSRDELKRFLSDAFMAVATKGREAEQMACPAAFLPCASKARHGFSQPKERQQKATRPMRIIIVPDGDAYHASCPDVPLLYGCGATPQEAEAMLYREIRSMYNDLNNGKPLSDEMKRAKDIMNELLCGCISADCSGASW